MSGIIASSGLGRRRLKYAPNEFVSTWDTTEAGVSGSNQIALPLHALGTYDFSVFDENGNFLKHIDDYQDNIVTLPSAGVQEVIIRGQIERLQFNNGFDKDKIINVKQFGSDFKVVHGANMFWGCSNLETISADIDMAGVTSMAFMFRDCAKFSADLSGWDVSSVTNMQSAFQGCFEFTSDLSGWDVSSVTNMTLAFFQCNKFVSDLSGWDVGNVTSMDRMFANAYLFNSDLSNWNTSKVTNMLRMFYAASNFNFDISNWDFGLVTDIDQFMHLKTIYEPQYYTNLLQRWSTNAQDNLTVQMGSIKYTADGQQYRDILTNTKGWTITDGGQI